MNDTLDQTELPDRNTTESGLREILPSIPIKPGVYLMRNADGEIIYIGKALNLKKRIASYLKPPGRSDGKTSVLIRKIADVETIITASEKEALILEANLIKQHRPRYNVDLKDDKRYPLLRLNTKHPYPKLSIVRKTKKDGALYFGPYASAGAVRQTLKIINKAFKLRKCSDREFKTRTRPCLNCQMQGCLAPCCRDIDKAHYDEMVKEVILFLKGRRSDLVRKIKKQMHAAAERQEYEKAAGLRDKMFALEKTIEGQVAVSADLKDRDVIAVARTPDLSLVVQLIVRGGYLLGSRNFTFTETMANDAEIVGGFIRQHYGSAKFIPLEILIPVALEDAHLVEGELSGLKGRKVHLRRPIRGPKAQLLRMAQNNAEKDLATLLDARSKSVDILTRLQKRLKLSTLPERIECFDNSNISGTLPVASMVVFTNGVPDTSSYRKYKLKNVKRPDDYAYMNEVLRRRYGKTHASEPLPDLLILDGGKGQLGVASAVIQDLQLAARFEMIGIAKKDEERGEKQDKIYRPGRANSIQFGRDTDLLFFIQRIRDEAHRFAITYHRKRRNRKALASALDPIPGIGKKKKELLLKHFKSIDKIRDAAPEELSSLPGINHRLAGVIKESLAAGNR